MWTRGAPGVLVCRRRLQLSRVRTKWLWHEVREFVRLRRDGYSARTTRTRRRSKFARPYICLLIAFNLQTLPSTAPLL